MEVEGVRRKDKGERGPQARDIRRGPRGPIARFYIKRHVPRERLHHY